MTVAVRRVRGAGSVAVGALALFWLGTVLAGALAPGYAARADYVSSLAGRGSEVAPLGIAALTALALAHLAGAVALVGGPRAVRWTASGALAAAGACGLVVAAFRTGCPLGAAGCGTAPNDAPADIADVAHLLGVVGYEIALVVAMVAVAVRYRRRWPAVLTAAAAVASVVLALRIGGPDLGLDQRLWLAVNTGWLAALVLTPGRWPPRRAAASPGGPAAPPGRPTAR